MASVQAKKASSTGKLIQIVVDIKSNGAEIQKRFEPPVGKGGYPEYVPDRQKDSMVFSGDNWQKDAAEYFEECLGGDKGEAAGE